MLRYVLVRLRWLNWVNIGLDRITGSGWSIEMKIIIQGDDNFASFQKPRQFWNSQKGNKNTGKFRKWKEQKLHKMTSSSNLKYGNVWKDKLFEIINQKLKAQWAKYPVLLNFGVCCREYEKPKVTSFRAGMRSFCCLENMDLAKYELKELYENLAN